MRSTAAYLFLSLSLFVSSLLPALVPSAASAQDGGPPPEYRGLVDSALAEFEAEHWAEARALFERAHAAFPNARTLRGIGMAAFELRDYVAARAALEASLGESRRNLTDEQRAQVTELLGRTRAFVGDFAIGPAPAGTALDVDGVPTTPSGDLTTSARVALAVGAHELVLRAPDGRSARAQVTVHGGEDAELALAIVDVPVVSDVPPGVDPTPSPAPPPSRPDDAGPWVMILSGGVVAIVGVSLLGVGVAGAQSVQSAPAGTEWADLAGAYDRAVPLEIAGGIATGLGLAAVAGGLVWMATQPAAPYYVRVGPGTLMVGGTF